jgi:hypothetical protein
MKQPNTKRIGVGSDKGLTDLQDKINSLKSKGISKGYEAQGGIRGIYDPASPALPNGKLYYQVNALCFRNAWQYEDDDKQMTTVTVLGIPPVDSAPTAVKVAIAAKARQ